LRVHPAVHADQLLGDVAFGFESLRRHRVLLVDRVSPRAAARVPSTKRVLAATICAPRSAIAIAPVRACSRSAVATAQQPRRAQPARATRGDRAGRLVDWPADRPPAALHHPIGMIGRTSIEPSFAPGIPAASLVASSRSLASTR